MIMRRYFLVLGVIAAIFLAMFGVVEALGVPILTDPSNHMSTSGVAAALIGVGLLVGDVVLPTPSSLVMVAHGTLFGVVLGTALSLIGRAGSFAFGYYLGSKSHVLIHRFLTDEELERATHTIGKHGLLAIVGTRPIPILSETTSIAAGISKLPFGVSLLAATVGSIPEALVFAISGAIVGSFIHTSYVFIGLVIMMGLFWLISAKLSHRLQHKTA